VAKYACILRFLAGIIRKTGDFVENVFLNKAQRGTTFFIDPDDNNLRARHVYEKAGFNVAGDFQGEKRYWAFKGEKTYLMVKKI
jgi:RimJ/RimL family protein N-acetyltransferase